MTVFAETERLILRTLEEADAPFILEMDGDSEVLRYLPGKTISTVAEAVSVIQYIHKQYQENGIGRWAVIRKEDHAFLGWCGIKFVNDGVTCDRTDYYDLGYRFLQQYWGKGYAYEAAKACFHYGMEVMQLTELNATIMAGNAASVRIAEKLGLQLSCRFTEDGQQWMWYSTTAAAEEKD